MELRGCVSSSGDAVSTLKTRQRSDFSIARILGTDEVRVSDEDCAPEVVSRQVVHEEEENRRLEREQQRFEWLQCTRYRPPRLPRSRRREGTQRRKLGRNPRIPFSSGQVGILEQRFRRGHYLSSADVAELAAFLTLSETRVKIWFQNRRARERRDRELRQQQGESDTNNGGSPVSSSHSPSRNCAGDVASFTDLSRAHALVLPPLNLSTESLPPNLRMLGHFGSSAFARVHSPPNNAPLALLSARAAAAAAFHNLPTLPITSSGNPGG